jgi:hypothetical protein
MEEPMLLQTSVESDDSLDRIDMGLKKRFRKFRKLKAMARRLQESSSDNDSKSTATSQLHSGKRTQARYKTDVSEESTASNDEDDNVLLEQFIAPKTPPLRRYGPRFRHGKLSCGRWARKANTGKAKKRKVSMIEYLEHDEKDNRSESNFDGEHVFQLSFASAEIDGSSSEDSVVDANLSLSHGKETEENVSDLDESILSRDHVENTESDFIQPEGDADELPRDVEDQTGKVPFGRLPFFFDEKANVLEKERIPEAGAKIFELERRWSRAETMEEKETVLCECKSLRNEIIEALIRNGSDQCQTALRKLSSRRLYKRHRSMLSSKERDEFRSSAMDIRDMICDALCNSIERLIIRIRQLSRVATMDLDNRVDLEFSEDCEGDDCWTSREELPLERSSIASDTIEHKLERMLEPCDPHMHARFKRRKRHRGKIRPSNVELWERKGDRHPHGVPWKPAVNSGEGGMRSDQNHPQNIYESAIYSTRGDVKYVPTSVDKFHNPLQNDTNREKKRSKGQNGALSPSRFWNDERNYKERANAISRMEHFIEANSTFDSSTSSDGICQNFRKKRSLQAKESFKMRNATKDTVVVPGVGQAALPTYEPRTDLYRALGEHGGNSALIEHEDLQVDKADISLVCEMLCGSCSYEKESSLLKKLLGTVRGGSFDTSVCGSLVFTVLLEKLRSNGSPVLQELLAKRSQKFGVHCQLLSTILELLRMKANSGLDSGGVVYEIFAPGKSNCLVKWIVLQLVEAVLSLVHPRAWSLKHIDTKKSLRELEVLRAALAEHCHVLDRACRCIMEELQPQQWRCDLESRFPFVSSIDPDSWRLFLHDGLLSPATTIGRFHILGEWLPRREVEGMWCALAFFAAQKSSVPIQGSFCWKLLSRLVSCGIIGDIDQEEEKLPPCSDQLDTCTRDLQAAAMLILSGSMDGTRSEDSFVTTFIRRALMLKATELFYCEDARLLMLPSATDLTGDKRTLRTLWSQCDTNGQKVCFSNCKTTDCGGDWDRTSSILFLGRDLVQPLSVLLKACLYLLASWSSKVSMHKSRRKRFAMAFSVLVKRLISDANNSNYIETPKRSTKTTILFEEAFSSACPSKYGLGSARRSIFLLESAGYINMSVSFAASLEVDSTTNTRDSLTCWKIELCQQSWTTIADFCMKERQTHILRGRIGAHNAEHVDDPCRLLAAAKLCSHVALTLLGFLPLKTDLCTSTMQRGKVFSDFQALMASVKYLISCMLACVDCACDIRENAEIVATVTTNLSLVLRGVAISFHRYSEKSESSAASDSAFLHMLIPTFQKGFVMLSGASFCGPEEDLCLMSLLLVLRQVLLLSFGKNSDSETLPSSTDRVHNDLWGGIDDSALTKFQEGLGLFPNPIGVDSGEICALLIGAISSSKPSTRFKIISAVSGMSTHGKMLVTRHVRELAVCLAHFVAASDTTGPQSAQGHVALFLSRPQVPAGFAAETNADAEFFDDVARMIVDELLRLVETSTTVAVFVREHKEIIAHHLFLFVLDPTIIKKVPSSNLSRFEANSNFDSAAKEYGRYKEWLRGNEGSLRVSVDYVWKACVGFGKCLQHGDSETSHTWAKLGKCLQNFDIDFDDSSALGLKPSLEAEFLRRLRLFRVVVTTFLEKPCVNSEITALVTFVIATASNHLYRLLCSLKRKLPCEGETGTYDFAQSVELFLVFAEFMIALLAWIASKCVPTNQGLTELLYSVSNHFLVPLLLKNDFDVEVGLQAVVTAARQPMSTSSKIPQIAPGSSAICPWREDLQKMVVRRSREWIRAIAEDRNAGVSKLSSLHLALVQAAVKDSNEAAVLFGVALSPIVGLPRPTEASVGVFPKAVFQYFDNLEITFPPNITELKSITDLMKHTLTSLLPNLTFDRVALGEKMGALVVIRYVLDSMHEEEMIPVIPTGVDQSFLCFLVDRLLGSMRGVLLKETVDDALVAEIYHTSLSIFKLPAASTCDRDACSAVGWLLDWCRMVDYSVRDEGEANSETLVEAKYLLGFADWMICFSKRIQDGTIEPYRQALRVLNLTVSDRRSWPDPSHKLFQASDILFPSREAKSSITNVYAISQKAKVKSQSFKPWEPGEVVCRAVRRFLIEIGSV